MSHVPMDVRRTVIRLLAVPLSLGLMGSSVTAQIHRTPDPVRRADLHRLAEVDRVVMVPMRDGVRLATEIYRPRNAQGPVPVIFWRTPYNFSPLPEPNLERPSALLKFGLDAIERGYAFVVQNERGKFFSEGDWEILGRPRTDGYDALTWIADQPWSSGKVATLGCSSTAEWQMGLAAMRHPAHAAAVPMGQGAGIGRMGPFYEQGNFYRGGALQLPMAVWLFGEQNTQRPTFPPGTSREDLARLATYFDLAAKMPQVDWKQALWHLPIQTVMESVGGPKGIFREFAERLPDDPAWYEGGLYHDDEPFGVPALWANSWYDLSVSPNLALYGHVRENADTEVRDHQYMVIAPSLHCNMYRLTDPLVVGERDFGDTDFEFDEMLWSFLDRFTKPEANRFEDRYAKVRYFLMGEDRWENAADWPPAGVEAMTFYVDSGGSANSATGDGQLTADGGGGGADADRFVYDPGSPVPLTAAPSAAWATTNPVPSISAASKPAPTCSSTRRSRSRSRWRSSVRSMSSCTFHRTRRTPTSRSNWSTSTPTAGPSTWTTRSCACATAKASTATSRWNRARSTKWLWARSPPPTSSAPATGCESKSRAATSPATTAT